MKSVCVMVDDGGAMGVQGLERWGEVWVFDEFGFVVDVLVVENHASCGRINIRVLFHI